MLGSVSGGGRSSQEQRAGAIVAAALVRRYAVEGGAERVPQVRLEERLTWTGAEELLRVAGRARAGARAGEQRVGGARTL